ncbi:MAG: HEAT repeat domain-containing protein [Chloroflexota bacterium]|nr:HEAT repeat domain-containing protein [Chloroflexota bacterium]
MKTKMAEDSILNVPPEDMIPSLAGASHTSRRYAAQMLGIRDTDQLSSFLLESMERGTVPMRQAVSETLGRLYGMRHSRIWDPDVKSLADLPYLDCLQMGIEDPDEITRANSVKSLGNLRQESRAVELLAMAIADPSGRVRVEAARGLGQRWSTTEGRAGVPALILALADPEPQVREQAAAALEYMYDKEARGPLLALLEDEDKGVRTRAALALGALGASEAVPMLISVLKEFESRFASSAATYLFQMQAEEALPVLKDLLRSYHVGVQ